MKKISRMILLCSSIGLFLPTHAGANCKSSPDDLHEPLQIKENCFHFKIDNTPIGASSQEFGIAILARNIGTATEHKLAELSYLAEPGKVVSAFSVTINKNEETLFVIQSFTIYSDTGSYYSSDYYVIAVFDVLNNGHLSHNKKLENYFGSGGDVFESNTSDRLDYRFPYKTRSSIEEHLASSWFKTWQSNEKKATVKDKAFIYDDASSASKSHRYLIDGDIVTVTSQTGGWLRVEYINAKKRVFTGWLQCVATYECSEQKRQ